MKSKIITLIVILLMSVNNTHANNEPPLAETFLFGVNLAGTFSENNLPELIQLSHKISVAEEAYSLLRSQLPDPSLATLPNPSPVVNDALDAMSVLDDHILEATKEIQAGKVVNSLGDIDISRAIQRISLGIGVASDIYSTYDILKKTMNGGASTTEKENYITNGTFSIIGLWSYLQAPPVASGVVFKSAGYIGLGYAALQLGAAWGEFVNGITVTGIIDDQVKNTLSSLEQVDELTRIILEGARNGKTTEELNMVDLVILVKSNAISSGVESIELLETPSAIISIIATGNVFHAENAKTLINDILDIIVSDQYSYESFQDIYQAGRLAYLSDNSLSELDKDDLSGSINNKNPWTLFLPAILAGASDDNVPTVTSLTGRIWMDRNRGASRVATSMTDEESYGDLYQWGRLADGHEKRTSATIATISSADNPGHGKFILTTSLPSDWRNPKNDDLWQGVDGTNNPCPAGFRPPTESEIQDEIDTWTSKDAAGAFASPLKLPASGIRYCFDGSLDTVGSSGAYWSSSVSDTNARLLDFSDNHAWVSDTIRASGFSVRCIKDEPDIVPTVTSATGRIWMDRNLGASRVATSMTDEEAYSDLYQWGRLTDGHEKRNPLSGTTEILSAIDNPGHDKFISTLSSSYYDWRSEQNDDLWQGVNGTNNPCPDGFRLPTADEWEAERVTWNEDNATGAFASPLKLILVGYRSANPIYIMTVNSGSEGKYWSNSVDGTNACYLNISNNGYTGIYSNTRGCGFSVRCIKD